MNLFNTRKEALDICAEFIPLMLRGPRGENAYGWCKDYNSSGRFFNEQAGWHFENQEDALVFTLTWG